MSFEHKQMKIMTELTWEGRGTHAEWSHVLLNFFRLVDVVGPVHISGMDDAILVLVTHHHVILVVTLLTKIFAIIVFVLIIAIILDRLKERLFPGSTNLLVTLHSKWLDCKM